LPCGFLPKRLTRHSQRFSAGQYLMPFHTVVFRHFFLETL
jgi:hypothetical protein